MLTQDELNALAQLLRRAPMTQAEALWTRELLRRLQPPAPMQREEQAKDADKLEQMEDAPVQ